MRFICHDPNCPCKGVGSHSEIDMEPTGIGMPNVMLNDVTSSAANRFIESDELIALHLAAMRAIPPGNPLKLSEHCVELTCRPDDACMACAAARLASKSVSPSK